MLKPNNLAHLLTFYSEFSIISIIDNYHYGYIMCILLNKQSVTLFYPGYGFII